MLTRSTLRRSTHALKVPLAVAILVVLSGCSLSPFARRTALFATAATSTTSESTNAYNLVERAYRRAQIARMMANYDESGFDTTKLQPFLSPKDLDARTDVLKALRSYAELLAAVSGDQSLKAVDASAKSLGTSLQGLSANTLLGAPMTSAEAGAVTTAFDALSRVLVEGERRRHLPAILHQMQQPIETICTLLQQDIGDPARSGLRNQLHISYLDLLREQKLYIAVNKGTLTPSEKRTELLVLPALAASELDGDRALAATQKALAQLARTHTALAAYRRPEGRPRLRSPALGARPTPPAAHSFYTSLQSAD